MTTRDVVVIGAGPAGSSVATALARQGWDVLLAERERFPRHKVCGEFLSHEAQASLRAFGLYENVANLTPTALTQATLVTQRGFAIQIPLPGCAWGVSRYALDATLATAAVHAGAELQTGIVQRIEQQEAHFMVHLQNERGQVAVRTRAVIAACGRHTGPALPPKSQTRKDPRQQAVGVHCHYTQVEMPAVVELFFFPGGYAGVNPVENGRVNVCLLASYEVMALCAHDVNAKAGKGIAHILTAAQRWNPALQQRLAGGCMLPASAVAVAPVDVHRPAAPWDGVACLGDTAAMISPLCGDGMAMALRSAEICAPLANRFLTGSLTLAAWRAAYSQQWRSEFDRRLRLGRVLQKLLTAPMLADLLIQTGRLAPGLARYLVRATRG